MSHIRPHSGNVGGDLREVWAYREVLYFLAWRDVKVRYSQTLLGAGWAVLQPALGVLVLTLAFARVPGLAPEGVAYPVFALCGLVPWIFFSNAVLAGTNSLVTSSNLVTKVYFPRVLVPAAAVLGGLPDLAFSSVLLGVVVTGFGVVSFGGLWLLPFALVLLLAVALGVALWTSVLTVRYRDVRHAVPFALQIAVFMTPVVYSFDVVPRNWRLLLDLNPMVGVIAAWRAAVVGSPLSGLALGLSCLVTAALLGSGLLAFRALEHELADVI